MTYKVNVAYTHDDNGYFVFCPELPGCHSQGVSFEEASANIKEALDLYLSTMDSEEIAGSLIKGNVNVNNGSERCLNSFTRTR